ncbi:MAG: Polyketide cyclase / dehydrase and lipid transport, partial [Actinomycetota bacterium]|nr:Polyketide cyclase / dehydrase and lipid transport [Actinomycetota bacterium]
WALVQNAPVDRIITHHSCTTVKRPAADVARYVLDPTTMPYWSAVIYDVEAPTAGVFEKGGRLRGRMHILGLSLAVEGEMVEFDPPGMRAAIVVRPAGVPADAGGRLEHELSVEDLGDACVLHFRNRLHLPDWIPPEVAGDGLVRHLFDQTAAFALANIRYILEASLESGVAGFAALVRPHLE